MLEELKNKMLQYSVPTKPRSFGTEYSFPEDLDRTTLQDLGSLMLKLAAWKGYALKILAFAQAEKTFVETKHDNRIAKQIAITSTDKRTTKDAALGRLILEDEDFRKTKEQLTSKTIEVSMLKDVIEIYAMQIEVLSREFSRRSLEFQMLQKGI